MGVEDPDWRSQQSLDHAVYGGVRTNVLGSASNLRFGGSVAYARATGADIGRGQTYTGGEAAARALRKKIREGTSREEARRQRREEDAAAARRASSDAAYRRGNAVAIYLQQFEDPVKGTKTESRRGRAKKKFTARDLARGPNAAFESTLTKKTGSQITHRNLRTEGTRTYALRLRGSNPFGGAVVGAGNQLVQIYADLWYQQRAIRQRRAAILGVGRRGAAATRTFQPSGAGLTNRTGAGATRSGTASASGAGDARRPALSQPVPKQLATPASAPLSTPKAVQAQRAVVVPQPRQSSSPSRVSVNWDPWKMLQSALAPPVNYVRATAQRLSQVARTWSAPLRAPASSSSSSLTPVNSGLIGFSSAAGGGPDCKCPPKKRRSPTCRNPVVSKTRRGDLVTITRRMTCPPSRPK